MHLRELDANLIVILDALLLDASVTKAAERLGRSPSAVSHALSRLREIFNDPLFVRAGQRLVPTSRATQIAPTVHVIVSGLESLLRRQHAFEPGEQERRFMIACPDVFELTLLPEVRAELAEDAPGITLERVGDETRRDIVKGLRSDRLHVAIIAGGESAEAGDIAADFLFEDRYLMLAPESYPNARDGKLRPYDLTGLDAPAVFVDDRYAKTVFAAADGMRPARLRAVASPLVAVHAALAGGALALVPESVAAAVGKHLPLKELDCALSLPPVRVNLLWHVSQERDACHTWLRDKLRAHASADAASTQQD